MGFSPPHWLDRLPSPLIPNRRSLSPLTLIAHLPHWHRPRVLWRVHLRSDVFVVDFPRHAGQLLFISPIPSNGKKHKVNEMHHWNWRHTHTPNCLAWIWPMNCWQLSSGMLRWMLNSNIHSVEYTYYIMNIHNVLHVKQWSIQWLVYPQILDISPAWVLPRGSRISI